MRKLLSYLIIILLWGAFSYIYFSMYEANMPVSANQSEGTAAQDGEAAPQGILAQLSETSRQIRPDMVCIDTSALLDLPWSTQSLVEGIQSLHISTVRIPGGEPAGYWQWQTGEVLPDETRTESVNKENSLERYLATMMATETSPILVLNMITADLQDQLAMLQAVGQSGLPVRYIELGYDLYQGGLESNYGKAFPTGSDYTAVAEEWVAAIRSQFPEVEIALVAASPSPDNNGRIDGWNEAVFALAESQNLAVALYPFPVRGLEPGQPFNEEQIPAVLRLPFDTWERYTVREQSPLATLPSGVPIWLTAYNIPPEPEGDPQISEKYGQVLFVLAQSMIFLEDGRVEFMCPYQLMGDRQTAAFIRHGQRLDLMPTGKAVQILGQTMNGMTEAQKIAFTNVPSPNGTDQNYPTLVGWMFKDGNGRQTALLMNLGSERLEINVSNLPADFPRYFQQIIGDPTRRTRNDEGVEIINGDIIEKEFLLLAPYSVTVFSSVE